MPNAEQVVDRYRNRARQTILDPVRFVQIGLGHDTWDKQEAILRSVLRHEATAVKACHSSSKTFSAAELVWWWLVRFRDEGGKVITTAPGYDQVKHAIWGEVRSMAEKASIDLPPPDKAKVELGPDCYALGLSTNEHMRFAGYKGQRVLIVVDEGPGVRQVIWDAIDGLRAGGTVHLLVLGQPLVAGGPFYDAFHKERKEWHTITIDAFDTPNLRDLRGPWERQLETLLRWNEKGDDRLLISERPYLAKRKWVVQMHNKWGLYHVFWSARVRGDFNAESAQSVVPLSWAEPADTSKSPSAKVEIDQKHVDDQRCGYVVGVDPAAEGSNLTVCYVRQGKRVVQRHEWPEPLPTGKVRQVLNGLSKVTQVNVDPVGIGYGMAKDLHEDGYRVAFVNVGEGARDSERFLNLRAELYWGLRDRFEAGDVTGVLGEECLGQLATMQHDVNARGQIYIEPKDKLAARGVASPDHADALMLVFANVKPRGGRTDLVFPSLHRE